MPTSKIVNALAGVALVALLVILLAPRADGQGTTATNVYPRWFTGSFWTSARGDATGGGWFQGPAAHDAPVAGNPLRLGAECDSTVDAVDDNDIGTLHRDCTTGELLVAGAALTELANAITGGILDMNLKTIDDGPIVYDPCGDLDKRLTLPVADAAGTASEQLLALDGSDLIYVCGYDLTATGASLVTLNFGDGTACSTNTVQWTAFRSGGDGGGLVRGVTGQTQKRSAAGRQLCVVRGTDTGLYGSIEYVQEPAP